jgi:hypothetical protein
MKKIQLCCFTHIRIWSAGFTFALVATLSIFLGCSHTEKVWVPPRVELNSYRTIGVIEFSTNAEQTLKPYVTQNFIENIQSAQPGTRILELGDEDQLLRSMGHNKLNLESIQSIGRKYGVDALILGHLEVSEIKPNINLYAVAKTLNAKAYIEAALRTRILETDSGATFWTRASSAKTHVAKIYVTDGGALSFGVSDPREKYGKLVPHLVYDNTSDFRSRYEYRTAK